jgi:heptaprenyl diphosphate synthase
LESLSRDEVGATLELVSEDLERIEGILQEAAEAASSFLTEATTYLIRAGGKRVRPALVVLAAMIGEGANRKVDLTAAAVELTHIATLYHDDVIEDADLRRGVPTVNEKWNNTVAVLAGDHLFARASRLAAEVGDEVTFTMADTVASVVQGQVTELEASYDPERSEEHYFETIKGKTVSLLETAAELGASLGGCNRELVGAVSEFGNAFGYAFQVADDLLDFTASREDLGKDPGIDVRGGVYNLPVIYALQNDPSISRRLGPEVDYEWVLSALVSTGAFDRTLGVASEYVERSIRALDVAPDSPAKEALERLSRLMVERVPVPK